MNRGFVDLQINGYRGVNFSAPGLTMDDVRLATGEIVKRGTVAYCPTVITAGEETYRENLPLLARAMEEADLAPHILGIHMEGPFISPLEGPRGMHEESFVRPPGIKEYEKFQELADGKIVIITLAPEREGAKALIKHIVKQGIATVSLGHHLADKESLRMASREGARCCTHLGNGISNLIPRHPNPLWTQLADDSLSAMFITDGHHLPGDFIKVALRAKMPERFIVTSDISPIGGLAPGNYQIAGYPVVFEDSGKIRSLKQDCLAGSGATLIECLNVLSSLGILTEDELWQVGMVNPLGIINKKAAELSCQSLPEIVYEESGSGKVFRILEEADKK